MPDQDAEQEAKLIEELDPNKIATPAELGVTGTAEGHDVSVDFGSAIDDVVANMPAKEDAAVVDEPDNKEANESEEQKTEEGKTAVNSPVEAGKDQASEEAAKKPDDKSASDRDSDLNKFESGLDPHTKPKTRKIIDGIKAEATKARDRAEAAEKARSELETKAADLEKRVSSTKLPDDVDKELSSLRDTVRQLNIERDPSIVTKYDAKIEANTSLVLDTLKKAGLPDTAVAELKKSGIRLNNVKAYIDMLDTGRGADGKQYTPDPEAAAALREALVDNGRLSKAKDAEISEWKTNWESRQKTQQVDQQKYIEEANQRQSKAVLEHASKFDFLKPPPEPVDSDSPAIKKDKEKARVAFNGLVTQYSEAIKKETADPISQLIAAKVGIMYRDLVVPRLQEKAATLEARIKELEGRVSANKQAGSVSRTVSPTPVKTAPKKYDPADDINDDDPFGSVLDSLTRDAMTAKE